MMKRRIPTFLSGVLAATLVFSLGLSAMAASGTLTGQVTFGGVNVFVGEKQGIFADETLKTSNGQGIPSTITYTDAKGGGTVYLPVRKMTELFETDVSFQVGTSNIYFDEVISKYTAKLMATLVDGDYPKNSKGETYGSRALAEIVGRSSETRRSSRVRSVLAAALCTSRRAASIVKATKKHPPFSAGVFRFISFPALDGMPLIRYYIYALQKQAHHILY